MPEQKVVVLNKDQHRALTYTPLGDYSFAAGRNTVPLLPFEVPQAATCFPVIFPDKRSVIPHALLGLGDRNIFVDEQGRWKAPYIPLMVSNYPFSIVKARFTEKSETEENQKPEYAIGIEEDAPHFHQDNGQPLYDANGEATETLVRIRNALAEQYKRYKSMSKGLAELALHDALKEQVVAVGFNGKEKKIGGLRCVDRDKILVLPENTLGHLVKNGIMELLYAHWQSMRHLRTLLEDPFCPLMEKSEPIQ